MMMPYRLTSSWGTFCTPRTAPLPFLIDVDQLGQAGTRRIDDFVAKDNGEGFVADQPLGAEHGMS